jgi:hypothetical protein
MATRPASIVLRLVAPSAQDMARKKKGQDLAAIVSASASARPSAWQLCSWRQQIGGKNRTLSDLPAYPGADASKGLERSGANRAIWGGDAVRGAPGNGAAGSGSRRTVVASTPIQRADANPDPHGKPTRQPVGAVVPVVAMRTPSGVDPQE